MSAINVNTPQYFNRDRLSHAYIVSGGFAETLAMTAVCSSDNAAAPCMNCSHCNKASRHIHPDIIVVDKLPDKREIVIEQIRALKKDVIVVPNEAEKKVYIINDADSMNISAQNALLQILEEPPVRVVFILVTENPAILLPTVRSRCIEHKAAQVTETTDLTTFEMVNEFFSSLERGNFPLTEFMFRLEKLDKNEFSAFLTRAREQTVTKLKTATDGDMKTLRDLLAQTERILTRAEEMFDLNVNSGHISAMICASLMAVES